ncbi:DNA-binding response regulator [Actinoplanes lobatus]|uniref:DNA-binding NarL/FixJ family response regulator n=1 Tax=Actinoplanes lobatus TaxID=113568 RepID=A0A7W7HCK0_9ACTN|nr:response regulator transcription factor [Actinoplanes lobatus]MBB4748033.1 DNA-binding NarL/FixJ family response regulator [Actinoplanes lobatus]GGN80707.1 DNA-binding response regulator [Actinoplanes lobatus]GIE41500.1 DNA-binding response regulator [Actinoplanes lobatus]
MTADAPVRVLVADDQALIREGIASLLGIEPGIEVVGTAADGRAAVELALATVPDVVLMDVRMPVLDGLRAAELLRERLPACRVLMLTTFDDEEYVIRALRAGTGGYLLKDLPPRDLARAVRLARSGVDQHDSAVVRRLVSALDRGEPMSTPRADLTDREHAVLRLIARGATNREIAAKLYVSEGTVKNHVSHILARLGLRDRTQAAIYARDHGLL